MPFCVPHYTTLCNIGKLIIVLDISSKLVNALKRLFVKKTFEKSIVFIPIAIHQECSHVADTQQDRSTKIHFVTTFHIRNLHESQIIHINSFFNKSKEKQENTSLLTVYVSQYKKIKYGDRSRDMTHTSHKCSLYIIEHIVPTGVHI